MSPVHLVHFEENLDWFIDESWPRITLNVQNKRDVMSWLTEHTHAAVVVHGGARVPDRGDLGWNHTLMGSFSTYDFYFESSSDAQLFALTWR